MINKSTAKNKYSSIIILLLVVCLGYTGYLISSLNKENHEISKELSNLLKENNEMNKTLLNEEALSASKALNLKDNLKLLLVSYDSLELSNTLVVDKDYKLF
jgi:predicted Holliday junction resolvase-like endonuclease